VSAGPAVTPTRAVLEARWEALQRLNLEHAGCRDGTCLRCPLDALYAALAVARAKAANGSRA
jgi:hypothetical protein